MKIFALCGLVAVGLLAGCTAAPKAAEAPPPAAVFEREELARLVDAEMERVFGNSPDKPAARLALLVRLNEFVYGPGNNVRRIEDLRIESSGTYREAWLRYEPQNPAERREPVFFTNWDPEKKNWK